MQCVYGHQNAWYHSTMHFGAVQMIKVLPAFPFVYSGAFGRPLKFMLLWTGPQVSFKTKWSLLRVLVRSLKFSLFNTLDTIVFCPCCNWSNSVTCTTTSFTPHIIPLQRTPVRFQNSQTSEKSLDPNPIEIYGTRNWKINSSHIESLYASYWP